MDGKTELLINLLHCGYADIDALVFMMDMSSELTGENLLSTIIDEYYGDGVPSDFNSLMYHLMTEIVLSLISELDANIENDANRYTYILDDFWDGVYTNYMDSHFQIDCLDAWRPGDDKDRLLDDLKRDIFDMRKR
jgi:hypothetical protein